MISLLQIARNESEHEAWKLVTGALADISEALDVFRPQRGTRKITVFGSARTTQQDPVYQLAEELARLSVETGFQVMTGAGGGVMEGANSGAGCEHSIGLNVDLPFEQHPNPFVSECEGRLLYFRYFFTRKLFFLRESDALVVMPGGFGTLDELFEALTLIQTGRTQPIPLVLLAPPGDDFWSVWKRNVNEELVRRTLRDYGGGHNLWDAFVAMRELRRDVGGMTRAEIEQGLDPIYNKNLEAGAAPRLDSIVVFTADGTRSTCG